MILTPTGFVPDLDAVVDDDVIAHVFHRDRLIQRIEAPALLPWGAYRELGLVAARTHVIGRHESRVHVAIALADDDPAGPPPVPAGWQALGLRGWFGQLQESHLAIAMRAVQVLEWDCSLVRLSVMAFPR